MDTNEFYETILGVSDPWEVESARTYESDGYVEVYLVHDGHYCCPHCGTSCSRHDSTERRWRHLDTCEYQTILAADIPRVRCPEHGVQQVRIPWADGRAPFTVKFECYVIDLLLEGTVSGTSRITGVSWDSIAAIQERATERGLSRRRKKVPRHMGVDETSAKKNHKYVTIVSDQDTGLVISVSEGKSAESLDFYYESLTKKQRSRIQTVAMDMSCSFISSTQKYLPQADSAICFDRFHVTQMFNDAINAIRNREHTALKKDGNEILKGTRHAWLYNDQEIDGRSRQWFNEMTRCNLATARAWSIKEAANCLWSFASAGWARRSWKKLIGWMDRSQLPEIKKVSKTIKNHLWGIINAAVHHVTNSPSESINARVQKIKARACGFKNNKRYISAIYFHLGGLDLYPRGHF